MLLITFFGDSHSKILESRGNVMIRKCFVLMLAVAFVLALVGCSEGSSSNAEGNSGTNDAGENNAAGNAASGNADNGDLLIGASVPSLEFTFFVAAQKSWEEAADELGVEAPFYNAEDNQSKQNQDLEDMVTRGVDAIVVIPITTEGAVPAIKYANENGVPVFTVDRSAEGEDVEVVAHIGTNHVDMGEKAAQQFLEGLEERHPDVETWKVAELEGTPGSSAAIERGQGIHNVLEADDRVEIVTSLTGEFSSTVALDVAEDILTSNPELHGIISHNDMMIEGALQAASAANRADELVLVGMDGQKSTVQHIIEGNIYGTSLQLPSMLGDGLRTAVDYLNGEDVEENVWVPTELIDSSNAEEMLETEAW